MSITSHTGNVCRAGWDPSHQQRDGWKRYLHRHDHASMQFFVYKGWLSSSRTNSEILHLSRSRTFTRRYPSPSSTGNSRTSMKSAFIESVVRPKHVFRSCRPNLSYEPVLASLSLHWVGQTCFEHNYLTPGHIAGLCDRNLTFSSSYQ